MNDQIYAIGGTVAGNPRNVVEMCDPASNTWTTKAHMPTARLGFAAGVVNDHVYAIEGWGGYGVRTEVEMCDPTSDKWTTLPSAPTARRYSASAAVGNQICVIGGNTGSGTPSLKTVEQFTPGTTVFLLFEN